MTSVSAASTLSWPLTTTAAASLTVGNIQAMTTTQAATLTSANLNALASSAFAAMSAAQVSALSAAALSGLSQAQAVHFSTTEIAALSPSETSALTTGEIAAFSTVQVAALKASGLAQTQAAALSAAQTQALTAAQLNALSTSALHALNAAYLSTAQVAALTTTAFSALSSAQLGALLPKDASAVATTQLAALTSTAIAGLATNALSALTTTQADSLSATDLDALGSLQMQALKLSALSANQIAGLSATAVGAMSATEMASALGGAVAALTTTAVKGMTAAQIGALSTSQINAFTSAQQSAMSSSAAAAFVNAEISRNGGSAVLGDLASQEQNGAVSYNGLLKVLDDAASGGMTTGKFDALTEIANSLDTSSGPSASAYVAQIFDDVVKGNSANATWTGGGAASTKLGNLSATSSQTQVNELIGKWFLGTDLPQNATGDGYIYTSVNQPLFNSTGSPQVGDIQQGQTGDCYFLAALASTAQQDPSLIKNMVQSNGNGCYSVDFHVNGQDDYVTVNNQLLTGGGGYANDAPTNGDMWAALVEKAYVELATQTGVSTATGSHANSYATIAGGAGNGLSAITGQSTNQVGLSAATSSSSAKSELSQLQAALGSGEDVIMGTTPQATEFNGNLVSSHMYAVTAVNASAGTVTLFNPWGNVINGYGMNASFTVSIATLAKEGVYFWSGTGNAAVA